MRRDEGVVTVEMLPANPNRRTDFVTNTTDAVLHALHPDRCFGPWLSMPGVEQPVRFMATQTMIPSTGPCPRFRCSECKVEYDKDNEPGARDGDR